MKREKKTPNQKFSGSIFLDGALLSFLVDFFPPLNLAQLAWQKLRWYMFYNCSSHCEFKISLSMSLLFSLFSCSLYLLLLFPLRSPTSAEELDVILLREQLWHFVWMGLTFLQFGWPRENDNQTGFFIFFSPHHFSNPGCGRRSIYLEEH